MREATRVLDNIFTELVPARIFKQLASSPSSSISTTTIKPEEDSLIFEAPGDDHVTDCYRMALIRPRNLRLDWRTLLSHINPSTPISLEDAGFLDSLSQKMNDVRNVVSSKEATATDNDLLVNAMSYLYYLGNLHPILANTRIPFTYNVGGTSVVGHSSLHFETLMMMWLVIARIYTHEDARKADNPTQYRASMDFCIDIASCMIRHVQSMKRECSSRLIYQTSPFSISSTSAPSVLAPNSKIDESEQCVEDEQCVEMYFGGVDGIKARRHILYAKKYEAAYDDVLNQSKLVDVVLWESVSDDNRNTMLCLAGAAKQISESYTRAWQHMPKNATYFYTLYKSHQWLVTMALIASAVNFHNVDDHADNGRQALKRIEEALAQVTSFKSNFLDDGDDDCYHPSIKKAHDALLSTTTVLHQRIYERVTGLDMRVSDGVILDTIENVLSESTGESDYEKKMKTLHNLLCKEDLRGSIDCLYNFKKASIATTAGGGNSTTLMFESCDDNGVEQDLESDIKMAVLHERLNWIDYLLGNERLQRIVLDTVALSRLREEHLTVTEFIETNKMNWQPRLDINNKLMMTT